MIKREPLVSVIIPVFNGERFLRETVASVLTQTINSLEVVVVDDGSTDGTPAIIEELAKSDTRVASLVQKNAGVSAARNLGYKHATGKYLAFLDADDIWMPDNLEQKIKKLESADFGLVHADVQSIDESGKIIQGEIMKGCEGDLLNGLLEWKRTQIPGPSSVLVKREVLEKIGLFDERLSTSADQDFFIRVAAQFKVGRVNRIASQYRVHSHNMHKNISRMEHDVLIVFNKANQSKLFSDKTFERACFANMYLILAASWAGDGKNSFRAARFVFKALLIQPSIISKLLARIFK